MPNLPHRQLGKTGLDVSVVGFGAAPAAYLMQDQEAAANLVSGLLDRGLNLIDTATSYPGSHDFLGEHLSDRRDDFVLVSKVGRGGDPASFSADNVAKDVDNALKQMKTDVVDVMLLHTCSLEVLQAGEALGALVKAREAGKIRFCGYSGDNEAATHAAKLPDVAVIETSVNLADQANIEAVLPLVQQNHIGVIAKRPIANAAWKDIGEQQGFYQKYAQTYTDRLSKMKLNASDFGMDWPELALRFTLSQPGVTTAIIGTTNPKHAYANLDLATKGELDAETVEKVRKAFADAADGSWAAQT